MKQIGDKVRADPQNPGWTKWGLVGAEDAMQFLIDILAVKS